MAIPENTVQPLPLIVLMLECQRKDGAQKCPNEEIIDVIEAKVAAMKNCPCERHGGSDGVLFIPHKRGFFTFRSRKNQQCIHKTCRDALVERRRLGFVYWLSW